ncbi:MAG: OmpA family protein [Gammaproteobacteria bacterium]
MIKNVLIGLGLLFLFHTSAQADAGSIPSSRHKDEMGLGAGALIGGLIAGPPGAVIGAAGGAWFGNREAKKDIKIATLEKRLTEKQTDLAYLQTRLTELQSEYGSEMKKVKLDNRLPLLHELTRGVSLIVYFRTNRANIEPEIIPRIARLAGFLRNFPEIKLRIEAYADRRGREQYNQQLSGRRAQAVEDELIGDGLQRNRISSRAYGESRALAAEGDREGYVFDRRVIVHLTLDSEV